MEVKPLSYSVRKLAEMRLPGYPGTERAWLDLVKKMNWPAHEFRGNGRGGIRREYIPPPEVQALIDARRRGEIGEGDERGGYIADQKTGVKKYFSEQPKKELLHGVPSAEWLILTTIAISEADWLPDSVKQDRSAQIGLALKLFGLLSMHLGDVDAKWQWMMDNQDSLQHALHFMYDLDQMESALSKKPESNV